MRQMIRVGLFAVQARERHWRLQCVWFFLLLGAAVGCGGGPTVVQPSELAPSNLVYPQTTITVAVGQSVSHAPTVSGTVTSYSINPALPAGLSLNNLTGTIWGTPTVVAAMASYVVTAANSAGTTTATIQILINPPAPTNLIYPQRTITAVIGQAIATNTPTVTGTVTSYAVSPPFPPGLNLNNSTGAISGTPTAVAGPATYTVTATNAGGSTSATIQITVNVAAPKDLSYAQPTITATVGVAISADLPTVTGSVTSYTVSSGLPGGLSLNSSTGAISGTPIAVSPTANYTITASNVSGSTTAIVEITVNAAVAPANLAYPQTKVAATVGKAITPDIPTVTGTPPSYAISPALPAGLTLSNSTGAISGTPTVVAATATYTVTATNSAGSTTATVEITVVLAAPTNLYYWPWDFSLMVGRTFTSSSPVVTGVVTSYTIDPALPSGLNFNTATGMISGTPLTPIARTGYLVTASNSTGSVGFWVQITVNPMSFSYPQSAIAARVGEAITTDIPDFTIGVPTYSVSPALPPGLSINASNGAIFGTPTAKSASATYTVTAVNSFGRASTDLTIAVDEGTVLLELGHVDEVQQLRVQGNRVLSLDRRGHWVLWDYSSTAMLAQGEQGTVLPVDMAGPTFVIGVPNGLEVRSASDGHLLAAISYPAINTDSSTTWWRLASDGSYICAGSTAGLLIWTPDGQGNTLRAGDYSKAKAFAAPLQVRIGLGPAGENVVETILIADGTSSVTPAFSGAFNSWFLDGERFLTNVSTTVWVYSKTGTQEGLASLPTTQNLTGQGPWIWTYDGPTGGGALAIYAIGSSTPAVTYTLGVYQTAIGSGTMIGIVSSGEAWSDIIDLAGATPVKTRYAIPFAFPSTFAAVSNAQWLLANRHGAVFDVAGTSPRTFGFGQVWSMVGVPNRVAISTAAGKILYYYPASKTLEGSIDFSSDKIAISSDGTVLAASANGLDAQYRSDRSLKIFSLPSGAELKNFPYYYSLSSPPPYLTFFTLAQSGTVLGQVLTGTYNLSQLPSRQVTDIMGSTVYWSDTGSTDAIAISPDGQLVAAQLNAASSAVTNIYKNGILMSAVPGYAVVWLTNDRILVSHYVMGRTSLQYQGFSIYSASGVEIASGTNYFGSIQPITSDLFYSSYQNAIYSWSTLKPVWTSPYTEQVGAVTISTPYVISVVKSRILMDTY